MSKIPNHPNQPDDGPGFAPARFFCCGLAVVALLFIALAKPAAQPVDGNAIPARLAKRSAWVKASLAREEVQLRRGLDPAEFFSLDALP